MSRGPAVHEIFSNQALESTQAFKFENQESKQQLKLGKKKTAAPLPPMKKFGGYKPKILGGQEDFLEVQEESVSKSNGSAKSRPAPVPQLTKPKPWVIGDKNVPMVLGPVDGDDSGDNDDNNNNVEQQGENSNIYDTFIENDDDKLNDNNMGGSGRTYSMSSSETSTLIHQDSYEPKQGIDNPVAYDSVSMNGSVSGVTQMITDNPHHSMPNGRSHGDDPDEPEGVFIPAPDYDEEEKTLDFTSEDTDEPSDGGEEAKKAKQLRPRPVIKEYAGEDLSHYLSDDDEDVPPVVLRNDAKPNNKQGKKFNTEGRKQKLSDKHSLFKQQPASTRSKRKSSGKGNSPGFNSVRSFSYADSKFGTKGKAAGKSMSFSELTDDSEKFLNTNDHSSSYESFLRSRHGETVLAQGFNDSGVDMGDDGVQLRHKDKDENVLKRLTLRIKKGMSKNLST